MHEKHYAAVSDTVLLSKAGIDYHYYNNYKSNNNFKSQKNLKELQIHAKNTRHDSSSYKNTKLVKDLKSDDWQKRNDE